MGISYAHDTFTFASAKLPRDITNQKKIIMKQKTEKRKLVNVGSLLKSTLPEEWLSAPFLPHETYDHEWLGNLMLSLNKLILQPLDAESVSAEGRFPLRPSLTSREREGPD